MITQAFIQYDKSKKTCKTNKDKTLSVIKTVPAK